MGVISFCPRRIKFPTCQSMLDKQYYIHTYSRELLLRFSAWWKLSILSMEIATELALT